MPNWACNHIIAYGDIEQINALANTLNTMPDHKVAFGRYWIGNLVAALLGLTEDEIMNNTRGLHYRGTFDPDFGAQAGFFGPCVDQEKEFKVDPDGLMRFSTISAWDHSEDVENLILEKFPDIKLAWSCTDEFGNFHVKHNPMGFPELDVIAFNGWPYRLCDIDELKRDMRSDCPGLENPRMPVPITSSRRSSRRSTRSGRRNTRRHSRTRMTTSRASMSMRRSERLLLFITTKYR
ncbi:MAG: hypothetical protein ACI3Y6_01620 [Candidatus Cryptobacteroides sp.]